MREFEAPTAAKAASGASLALFLAAVLPAAALLASCPNEAPSDPPVVGSWVQVQTAIRSYAFSSDGTVTLTIADPDPEFLPDEVQSIPSPEAGASYAVGDYVVTVFAHVYRCVAAGSAAAGAASALEAADAAAEPTGLEVGATIADGSVTWQLVDEVMAHGLWTLTGSSLRVEWTGAGSRVYTVTFYSSLGKKRMSMVALNDDGTSGAPFVVERADA